MRTTLNLDDDLFTAVKGIAASEKKSIGKVVSELLRQALSPKAKKENLEIKNGVPLLPDLEEPQIITPDFIKKLKEEIDH